MIRIRHNSKIRGTGASHATACIPQKYLLRKPGSAKEAIPKTVNEKTATRRGGQNVAVRNVDGVTVFEA